MSGIVTFAKSQPSPVWLRHLCWKVLPSAASDLILHSRYLYSPGHWATGIVIHQSARLVNRLLPANSLPWFGSPPTIQHP
jgi:hypothetical protein